MKSQRLHNVRQNMAREGLEQIIVSAPASVFYLTGIWVEPQERLLALYLDNTGKAILFANDIFGLEPQDDLPLVGHSDSQDPLDDLAGAVKAGKLGVDKAWPSKFLINLLAKRPDVRPVHGAGPVDLARQTKDGAEQEAMRHSSSINDLVMGRTLCLLEDGVVENELAWQINRLYLENGADSAGTQLVCFGANGADPHHAPDQTVIKPGDSVTIDIFTPINRYWCDMTRTVFYKTVSARQREVYQLVKNANEAAISLVRPGVLLSDLDKAARDIITAGGYGQFFTHRLGHGIGLDCHEPPDVSASSTHAASPGMVFSIEPGIYLPGEFGVRIEDLVLVTETGCQVLNKHPKDLQVIS